MTTSGRRPVGRPKDEGKRTAILEAAADCFLEHGFDGASMETIARTAGVSKLTLYSHFADKDALFREMIRDKCNRYAPPETFVMLADQPPPEGLMVIAVGVLTLLCQPEVVGMHRVVIGGAGTNPKLARMLFESGPERGIDAAAELLRAWSRRGLLGLDDARRAAANFFYLLRGDLYERVIFNLDPLPTEAQIRRQAAQTVETFLRLYARGRKQ
jgi:TetR/AcrR family transcriptional repressor of mexJK operon